MVYFFLLFTFSMYLILKKKGPFFKKCPQFFLKDIFTGKGLFCGASSQRF